MRIEKDAAQMDQEGHKLPCNPALYIEEFYRTKDAMAFLATVTCPTSDSCMRTAGTDSNFD